MRHVFVQAAERGRLLLVLYLIYQPGGDCPILLTLWRSSFAFLPPRRVPLECLILAFFFTKRAFNGSDNIRPSKITYRIVLYSTPGLRLSWEQRLTSGLDLAFNSAISLIRCVTDYSYRQSRTSE